MIVRWTLLFLATLAVILIPFFLFGNAVEQWAHQFFQASAARPLVFLAVVAALAADIFLPIPSSLVSTAAGLLLGFWPGFLANFLGMTLACALGYALGSRLPAPDADRMRQAWTRYGDWALILFRSVPVLAEASVFFAGLSRMPLRRFIVLTALSNLAISGVYSATGAFSAEKETFFYAFAGAVILPGLGMLLFRPNKP